MDISGLQAVCHTAAKANGWWDKPSENPISQQLMNISSEVAEAWEEIKNGHEPDERYYVRRDGSKCLVPFDAGNATLHKPEGVPSELADTIIRCLDTLAFYGIDAEEVILEKLRFNETRGHRHGGKKA